MKIWWRAAAAVAAAFVGVGVATVPGTPAWAAIACEVTYRTQSEWSSGFYGEARIKNTGDETWHSYTVDFDLPNGRITQGWNHIWTQSGTRVTARSTQWTAPVPPGGEINLGILASHNGTPAQPTIWRVNGVPCTLAGQPRAVIAEPDTVTVPEGSTGRFTVRLSHPPDQTVYLGMGMSGTGAWSAPPVALVFTPANWSTPQSYSFLSMPDADAVDDVMVVTLTAPAYAPDTVVLRQDDSS